MCMGCIAELTDAQHNINGVVHVGAHVLEEMDQYESWNISSKDRVWVEANPFLVEKNVCDYPDETIYNYIATSEVCPEGIKFNISNNPQCSSVLKLKHHTNMYPTMVYTSEVIVEGKSLDSMLKDKQIPKHLNLLSLDTQGYDLEVLKGATQLLRQIDFICTEVNYEEMYENCARKHELDIYLREFGFECMAASDVGGGWGDALYFKINPIQVKQTIDFICFSKNSEKLKCFLKRFYNNIHGDYNLYVACNYNFENFLEKYPTINFVDMKIFNSDITSFINAASELICFVTDFTSFSESINVQIIAVEMNKPLQLGFSLQLNKNLSNSDCKKGKHDHLVYLRDDDIIKWDLNYKHDNKQFEHAFDINGTVYHRNTLLQILANTSPNNIKEFEVVINDNWKVSNKRYFSAFKTSKVLWRTLNINTFFNGI